MNKVKALSILTVLSVLISCCFISNINAAAIKKIDKCGHFTSSEFKYVPNEIVVCFDSTTTLTLVRQKAHSVLNELKQKHNISSIKAQFSGAKQNRKRYSNQKADLSNW